MEVNTVQLSSLHSLYGRAESGSHRPVYFSLITIIAIQGSTSGLGIA